MDGGGKNTNVVVGCKCIDRHTFPIFPRLAVKCWVDRKSFRCDLEAQQTAEPHACVYVTVRDSEAKHSLRRQTLLQTHIVSIGGLK